jgi:ABC-2 type transport system ATP-binding protein
MSQERTCQRMASLVEDALSIGGLTKTFGRRTVVDDLAFNVRRGEVFGFLGPNGSGKTTTIRMALRIIRPDDGSVSIFGSPPDRSVIRRVGYLPEERGLPARSACWTPSATLAASRD